MCSSPKSSGTVRRSRIKGVFESMDPAVRASFVAKANAAQQRRSELKNSVANTYHKNAPKMLAKKKLSNKQPPQKEGLFLSLLHGLGFGV